jgi:GH35 family endo-1,4-beta-xylanase
MNALTYSDNLNASLDAPEIDPQHMVVANELLCGKSIQQIAELTGLSNDQVTAISERSEVRRYVDAVYMSQGYLNRVRRMDIINKVIDEKMAEAAETGIYSKRDLLEWLKLLNDMDKDSRPRAPTTAVQVNNHTNNYTNLMQDLLGDRS